jgi:hypothetical protein
MNWRIGVFALLRLAKTKIIVGKAIKAVSQPTKTLTYSDCLSGAGAKSGE